MVSTLQGGHGMTAKSIHQVQIHNEETLAQRHRESSEYMPEGIRCEGTKFIYSGNHLHMSSSIIMEFLALRVLQESRRCDTQGYNQKEIKCLECDFPRRDPTSSTSDHQLIKATRSLREAYMDYTGSLRKEDDEDPPVKKTQLNWYQMYYMLVSVAPRRLRRSDCSRRRSVLKDKMSKPRLVPSSLLKTLLATSMPWTCPVVRPRMSSTKTILRHRLWGVAWNSL